MNSVLQNWKTTVVGVGGSVLYAALGVYQHGMTLRQWFLAAVIAALGILTADAKGVTNVVSK